MKVLTSSQSARQRMGELVFGFMPTQLVYVMARLRVADVLADGPMAIDDLAAATTVPAATMQRLVRGLASVGLITVEDDGLVAVTDLGMLLGTETRGSMRDVALHFGGEAFTVWSALYHAATTGELAFDATLGGTFFDYLDRHPEAGAAFHGTMTQMSHGVVAQAVAAYDFSQASAVLDIAGGHGHFVAAVLAANPRLTGGLFDLPMVGRAAGDFLAERGLADRCAVVTGSFIDEPLPTGYDVHLLKWILHDWDDSTCATLLARSHEALTDDGRLLVVERLLPDAIVETRTLHPAISSDLNMLVNFGDAKERTRAEFDVLLGHSGFTVDGALALPSGFSVLVCRKDGTR